jgi:tetratricopeptide (TPR) repeat protein
LAQSRFFPLYLFLVLASFTGCQQYHDTTARFNAYFLANEKTLEVEETLYGNPQNNYNDILQVLAPIDTTASAGQATSFEYIITKASLPIQWHESSQWVDDCYILIGKARLYQGDFMNAVLTFKFVNTNSEDNAARHKALILLLRTFMASKQYENMFSVLDFIRKEKTPFNEENTREYHLTMAHYYRQTENYDMLSLHLAEALPLVAKRKEKARLHYLMAQLLEMQENEDKAYQNYELAFRYSPTYELAFHADLKRSGVSEIDSEDAIAEASKYFRKLLNDEKNWEYRDKIYYEMAKYNLRSNEIDEALVYLNESVQVSSNNTVQKAYSYLKMGQLYYYDLKDFEKAALYYDSTMQIMPTYVKNYEQNKELAETLKEFAKFVKQVREQDRLLTLAEMPKEALDDFLNNEIEQEKEVILKNQENRKLGEEKRKQAPSTSTDLNTKEDAGWYFYNATAKVFGQTNFIRTWGNRPLEDNWRRSRRQKAFEDNTTQDATANNQVALAGEKKEEEVDIFASVKSLEARKAEIPYSPEMKKEVMAKLESGLFDLGKVYYYRLEEFSNVIETYSRLHREFPQGQFTPEAMYILYTMCADYPDCSQPSYKDTIVNEFPESFYAKILVNPNYVEETNIYNQEAIDRYEKCFGLYKEAQYQVADSLLQMAIANYPNSQVVDKMHLLRAMIDGKTTDDLTTYYLKLNTFISKFGESELIPFAKDLLAAIKPNQIDLTGGSSGSSSEKEPIPKNR